jgi:GNAT superfamily N-acetyltransferase
MKHMALQFISDYKDNPTYRLSFNELAGMTFGIDFEKWYQLGFWNDRYICYSFADDNRVVSNVLASRLDLIWRGRRISALQIGTVMTAPEYRGRGLAAKLMNIVLKEYENKCELVYLFANNTVLDFYPKFGFCSSIKEWQYCVEIQAKERYPGEFRKLNLSKTNDLTLLTRMVNERVSISNIFDVDYAESILLWHCLYNFSQDIYYLQDLDILAIAKVTDDTLHLYDVIGEKKPEFTAILQRIASSCVKKVLFYFTPDFEDVDLKCTSYETDDYTFFVRSDAACLSGRFFYPITARVKTTDN